MGLDLNLLVVLRTVLAERSATAAARRLHVTQSAVSNALARLRAVLGDPLVVRNGRGLAPTPRALELAPELDHALGTLDRLIAGRRGFDPTISTRTFTVSLTDSYELSDLPRLVASFAQAMPRAQLRVITPERMIALGGLAHGQVDAAIVPMVLEAPGMRKRELFTEAAVAVVRRDHPDVGDRLTRAQFESLPHVEVRVVGEDGVGARLAKAHYARLGVTRNVAVVVPHFHAVAIAVAHSDAIGTLPDRFAAAIATMLPLRPVALPFAGMDWHMAMGWHEASDADPGSRYFRELVYAAFTHDVGSAGVRARRAPRGASASASHGATTAQRRSRSQSRS